MKTLTTLGMNKTEPVNCPAVDDTALGRAPSNRGTFMAWISRGALILILLVMVLFGGGYVFFRMEIGRLESLSSDLNALALRAGSHTAGIAVLTGDAERIETGLSLLGKRLGERLLISGVHERTSRTALLRAVDFEPAKTPCCIDIGHVARNTRGNAVETAHWARQHAYRSVWVVTSNYHMPRSLLELGNAMEGITLIPVVARHDFKIHPGEPNPRNTPPAHRSATLYSHQQAGLLRHSLKEYGKYLAAVLRIRIENGF